MTQSPNRRDVLHAILLGGAALSLGLVGSANAADKKADKKTEIKPNDDTEVIQLGAALDKLDRNKYTVVSGPAPEALQDGKILCSPPGSNKYYVDSRAADAKVTVYTE